jgi:uncharacterized protein YuzE
MKTPISLQITYRKDIPFAAYLYLAKPGQKAVRTETVSEDLLVDYASDDTPLGIEIVSPDLVSIDDILSVTNRLGLGSIEAEELKPLQAA